jgi:hypothetical protein
MASKRVLYDNASDCDDDDEMCSGFLTESDDDCYDSDKSDDECVTDEPAELIKQRRLDSLNKQFSNSIETNSDAFTKLCDKLNWVSTTPQPVVSFTSQNPDQVVKPSKRFGRFNKKSVRPLDVNVTVGYSGGSINIGYEPEPEPVKSYRVCKYVMNNEQCPYGDKCRYSHVRREVKMTTSSGKSKKIWMCRSVMRRVKCLEPVCPYAHSENDVRSAVTTCGFGSKCMSVRLINNTYVNVDGKRKCMRLHDGEEIRNFINRTVT